MSRDYYSWLGITSPSFFSGNFQMIEYSAFCETLCSMYYVMTIIQEKDYDIAVPVHLAPHLPPIGLSRQHVVEIDSKPYYRFSPFESILGSKIYLQHEGQIRYKFDTKLPLGQPIYVDFETSKLTWQYSNVLCGTVVKTQDLDGYHIVNIKFPLGNIARQE